MIDQVDPFLRWAGSKRRLLPKLKCFWETKYNRYIEPFMGSACLFFAIQPKKALLSDLNLDLVETFIAVRDHPRAVHNSLLKLSTGKTHYYRIRKLSSWKLNPIDRTARFIYLNRFCFNGLYRTNESGQFNVPYSPSGTGNLPTLNKLQRSSKILKNTDIRCGDFEEILDEACKGDFVYLDPPFAVSGRRVFREYEPNSFCTDDLKRLKSTLNKLDRRGVTFLVSYAMCKEALYNFKKWNTRRVFTQRNISGFAEHRRKAVELIIANITTK